MTSALPPLISVETPTCTNYIRKCQNNKYAFIIETIFEVGLMFAGIIASGVSNTYSIKLGGLAVAFISLLAFNYTFFKELSREAKQSDW